MDFFDNISGFYFAPADDSGSDTADTTETTPRDGADEKEPQTFTEDYVKQLRSEAAKHRKEKQELKQFKDKYDKISKLFDGDDDPEEQLNATKQKLQEYESELTGLKLRSTVQSEAAKQEADPDLTQAYLQSTGALNEVDPSDSQAISAKIKEAEQVNQSLEVFSYLRRN